MKFSLDAKQLHIESIDMLPEGIDESKVLKISIKTLSDWIQKLKLSKKADFLNQIDNSYVSITYDIVASVMFGIFPFYSGSKSVIYARITRDE